MALKSHIVKRQKTTVGQPYFCIKLGFYFSLMNTVTSDHHTLGQNAQISWEMLKYLQVIYF